MFQKKKASPVFLGKPFIYIQGQKSILNLLTPKEEPSILTLEEVAQYLRKSKSWVYKNWKILGGVNLRGSLFFPKKEELYGLIFHQGERVEVRLHPERNQVHRGLVQNQIGGKRGRNKKKGGDKKSKTDRGQRGEREDPNRHGLLGPG